MTWTGIPGQERRPDYDGPTRWIPFVAPIRRPRHPAPLVPVFVDRTGRRRRLLAAAGTVGTFLLVGTTIGLVLALTGTAGRGLPELPAARAHSHPGPSPHSSIPATSNPPTQQSGHTNTNK